MPLQAARKELCFKNKQAMIKYRHRCPKKPDINMHLQAEEVYLCLRTSVTNMGCGSFLEKAGLELSMEEGMGLAWGEGRIRAFQSGSSTSTKALGTGISMHVLSIQQLSSGAKHWRCRNK